MSFKALVISILGVALAVTGANASWDLSEASIPVEDILSGGPPKDGIPALTAPNFVSAAEAEFMRDDDKVIGFARDGVAKAYPTRIMSWHESVNDRIKGNPYLVSW